MRPAARAGAGLAVAVAALAGIAAASRVPLGPETSGAWLRLSWRAPGELVEECRTPTDEELAQLPAHMRQPRICEGRVLPYRLRVRVDGATLLEQRVEPAGARGDRPITVFHEIPLAPGSHAVEVTFSRLDPAPRTNEPRGAALPIELAEAEHGGEARPHIEEAHDPSEAPRAGAAPLPPLLRLSARFDLGQREVALLTYDADRRSLVLRLPDDAVAAGPDNRR